MSGAFTLIEVGGIFYGFNKLSGEIVQFDSVQEAEATCCKNYSRADIVNMCIGNSVYSRHCANEIKALTITVELSNYCNLDCIYCYQIDKGTRKEISNEIVDKLNLYVSLVYETYKFNMVILRFIGGEPLISTEKLILCYKKFECFCLKKGVQLYVHVDTNGTYPVSELIRIIHNLDVTICLTEKYDHDMLRSESYEVILDNLMSLSDRDLEFITIRYNVSHMNVSNFEHFLKFMRSKLPAIQSVATARIDDSHCKHRFVNYMNADQFSHWNATKAVNLLIQYGFKINHSTRSQLFRCQGYSKYSCKVYSDGKVTVCDAMYHNMALLNIDDLVGNIDLLNLYYKDIKEYSPVEDPVCSHCINLLQCGGKHFCRNDVCAYQSEFNELDFIKTYITHYQNGNGSFFKNMSSL